MLHGVCAKIVLRNDKGRVVVVHPINMEKTMFKDKLILFSPHLSYISNIGNTMQKTPQETLTILSKEPLHLPMTAWHLYTRPQVTFF